MMLEWLLAPVDATRGHDVGTLVAWHGRLMVAAWAILLPLGIGAARYFKITRRQKWPAVLDNKAWWYTHLGLQYVGGIGVLVAVVMILQEPLRSGALNLHALLGWSAVALTGVQFFGGWFRGSKGGPTAPAPDGSLRGDHYDMTRRRRVFEYVHKTAGYVALLIAIGAIISGLWMTNAPRWMWFGLGLWWLALVLVAVRLQRQGRTADTYQAIWGPDTKHPGNSIEPIGWGIRRR